MRHPLLDLLLQFLQINGICKIIAEFMEINSKEFFGLLMCIDQNIVIFDSNHNYHILVSCCNTWKIFEYKNILIRVMNNKLQKFIDLQWIDFADIDTTNYSAITMFNNKIISFGCNYNFQIDIDNGKVDILPNLLCEKRGHQVQVFQNRIYVLGGFGKVNQVHSFDGTEWKNHKAMPFGNYCFATAATNTHLYIFGGYQDKSTMCSTSNVFKYDPLIDKWEQCANMPHKKSNFIANFFNGYIYIFDQKQWKFEQYDIVNDCWNIFF